MLVSKKFEELSGHRVVYNIMPIENIKSVMRHGLVSFNDASRMRHTSIAMDAVQERRSKVIVTNGMTLHDYASVYFSYRNPMLYKRKDQAEHICILAISAKVLDFPECVVSDQNAASRTVRFSVSRNYRNTV